MKEFQIPIHLRWSDLDPNFHVRHSAYYDFGAQCRLAILVNLGITQQLLKQENFGFILFREECLFKKELLFGRKYVINAKLASLSDDFRKFTIVHEIIDEKSRVCAQLTVDGAWMNMVTRKIGIPSELIIEGLNKFPR